MTVHIRLIMINVVFRLRQFESAHSLQNYLETHLDKYKAQYGVLLFLYSVLLTKVQLFEFQCLCA